MVDLGLCVHDQGNCRRPSGRGKESFHPKPSRIWPVVGESVVSTNNHRIILRSTSMVGDDVSRLVWMWMRFTGSIGDYNLLYQVERSSH